MQSNQKRFDMLLRLKTMRRQIAEAKAASARRAQYEAEMAEDDARQFHRHTISSADETRLAKLKEVFAATTEHQLHNTLAVNAYLSTEAEIETARVAVVNAGEVVSEAKKNVDEAQAFFMQRWREREKTVTLMDRIAETTRLANDRRS